MTSKETKGKRRPKGGPALGDIDRTKTVFSAMQGHADNERRLKTDRLREQRLRHETENHTAEGKRRED